MEHVEKIVRVPYDFVATASRVEKPRSIDARARTLAHPRNDLEITSQDARAAIEAHAYGYDRARRDREALDFASLRLKSEQHIGWAPVVGGAIVVPVAIVATSRWQKAYRSEFNSRADERHRVRNHTRNNGH